MSKKNKVLIVLLPLIIAISIVVGIYLGAILSSSNSNQNQIFATHNKFNSTTKLNEILNFIENTYVDSVNKKDLTEKSISAMLSQLDPHSYYIPAKEYNEMNDPLEGNFDGIGIEFRIQEDTVMVVAPIVNGPSEKIGIEAGDRIIKVDSIFIAGNGITNDKVTKLLKGQRGTKVAVDVVRHGSKKILHFIIVRDQIPIYSVDSPYMIDDRTGYLKITRFAKTTYQEFVDASQKLLDKGMKNLIIDLRGNGGGVLSAATNIADEILQKNKMIVYTKGRVRPKEEYYSTDKGILEHTKIAILINENSASASEILTGSIQDNDRGIVVGRRSFGKGLVQEQVAWPDGSALRLTVARYYTPTGRCIQKPYSNESIDQYNMESYNRYLNGELVYTDSIHFPDSLKYFTPEGKVVYGGGGIMPDIFTPIDTIGGSNYLYQLRYNGIIQEFALTYADNHRKELNKLYDSANQFKSKFEITNEIFNDLIKFAEENKLKRNLEDIKTSSFLIKRDLKASISRDIWNDLGYYIIMNDNDKTLKVAIKAIEK